MGEGILMKSLKPLDNYPYKMVQIQECNQNFFSCRGDYATHRGGKSIRAKNHDVAMI